MKAIEESELDSAPDGFYTVLRGGEPVKKVEDYYQPQMDRWMKNASLQLTAIVRDMPATGELPRGVEYAYRRADGKMLAKMHMPESELEP